METNVSFNNPRDIPDHTGASNQAAAANDESSVRRFVYPALDRDLSLEILSPGEYQRAIDALANARDRRARGIDAKDEPRIPLPPSAAELHWQRDHPSLVGDDGGFSDTETPDDQEIP